jgi:hypothetical protein
MSYQLSIGLECGASAILVKDELALSRKSHPSCLLGFADLLQAEKEPKGSAQKNSRGHTSLFGARLLLEAMQNALA